VVGGRDEGQGAGRKDQGTQEQGARIKEQGSWIKDQGIRGKGEGRKRFSFLVEFNSIFCLTFLFS